MTCKLINVFLFVLILFTKSGLSGQEVNDTLSSYYNCSGRFHYFKEGEVLTIAEKMPEYPGGPVVMLKSLKDNSEDIIYTAQTEMQYKIVISFVVDTSGNVINKCIEKPYYSNRLTIVESNFLRALDKMPKWIPGEQNGKKVPVVYTLPVYLHMG
ncbi:MAG: hypothetical protein WAQ28_18990 [Bacteroidia bacterium]